MILNMHIRKKTKGKELVPLHNRSQDIVDMIVNHRQAIKVIFGVLVVLSLIFSPLVEINYDLTEYLPNTVQSKQGINLMEDEFGYPGTARVMIDDVSLYEAKVYKDQIEAVDGVDMVMWADSSTDVFQSNEFIPAKDIEDYYKDGHSVMDITFDEGDSSPRTSAAIDKIEQIAGDKGHFVGSAVQNKSLNANLTREVRNVTIVAVIVILAILCLTTTSWFEPVLFLLVMGIAIIINKGTNIFLGEVSFLTSSVSAILQLAVAMDYSIFLMHSFTKEKSMGIEPGQAIANAIRHSLKSILSCGLATMIGFIALTLMKFSLGFDLGIVLAKGILMSLLTVLLLMPSLILTFSGLIEKTAHKPFLPSFQKFGAFAYKIRYVVLVVTVLAAIPSYVAKDMNNFLFGNSAVGSSEGTTVYADEQAIDAQFGRSNMLMAMVPNTSMVKEKQLTDALEALDYTKNMTSLAGTLPDGIPESILPESLTGQLHTDNYSRILIYIKTKDESELAFKCSDEIQSILKQYYPEDSYLVGATPCTQDIEKTITADYSFVDFISILGVAVVVMLAFKSPLISVLVIIPIEIAIFINMAFPYFVGDRMVYIGYIIVSCIQLAATVDYGILMVNNYLDSRSHMDKRDAAIDAIAETAPPVLTSGMILACCGYILYFISSITAIGDMGHLIGRGALCGMALVIFMLPALLVAFDKPIVGHIARVNARAEKHLQKLNQHKTALKNRFCKLSETIAQQEAR